MKKALMVAIVLYLEMGSSLEKNRCPGRSLWSVLSSAGYLRLECFPLD